MAASGAKTDMKKEMPAKKKKMAAKKKMKPAVEKTAAVKPAV